MRKQIAITVVAIATFAILMAIPVSAQEITPGSWLTDQTLQSTGGTTAIAEADGSLVLNIASLPGTPGRNGSNGTNGTDGVDGQDGRGLSSIRWCPNGTLFAFYDDGSSELVGEGLLGVQDMHVEYGGELFLVFSNGEKRPILNLENMVEEMITRYNLENDRSKPLLPGWFWPAIIWTLLVLLAILLGVYFAQNANRRDQNEASRIGNMNKLIAGAILHGRTVKAKEHGKSGSEEFTILGGSGEIYEEIFTDEDWPHKRPAETRLVKPDFDADAKVKADAEAKRKADADAKVKADADAKRKADADAKRKADADAKRKADAKTKADADAKRKADAKVKADADAKTKADLESKTVVELKKIAKDRKIDLAGTTKKDEIIAAIIAA